MAKPEKDKKAGRSKREERKALLNELRGNTAGKGIAGYADYVEKMEALDALMEKYSAKNIFGAEKTMDAKARQDVLKAMRETAEAGEEYLQNAVQAKKAGSADNLKTGAPALVNRLQGLLIRDQEALEAYDPRIPMSMTQVQENARSTVVHLGNLNIEGLGGAQNSRLPVSFRDRSGKLRRGMFTKETRMTQEQNLDKYVNKLLETAASGVGRPGMIIRNLIVTYRDRHAERLANVSDAQIFHELADKCVETVDNGYGEEKKVLNNSFMKKELGVDGKTQLSRYAMQELLRAFKDYNEMISKQANIGKYVNSSILGIEKDARIDSRSSAMSSVANLLGAPGLIAGAENMKFVSDSGEVLEGTFMEEAEGIDLALGGDAFKMVNAHPFEGPNSGKGIRQMADLQVLDYICGNVDRHQGNLFYKTDANGDIVGVQGIDNDSSFGRFAHKDDMKHALPNPEDMSVISASMSKKVMKLTPAMLKYSLRGRGLSEEELDFAAKRLTNLQTAIKNGRDYYKAHPAKGASVPGYLRTVEDKDFSKLKLRELYSETQVNLFRLVDFNIQRVGLDQVKDLEAYAFDPTLQRKELVLREVGTAGLGFTGGNLLDALEGASKLVEDKEKSFDIRDLTKAVRGSSPEFDAMVEAAKTLAEEERELRGGPIQPSAYNGRRKTIDATVDELRRTNDDYLAKKMRERGAASLEELRGKNEYEQARIDHAMRIRKFCQDYQPAPPLTGDALDNMSAVDREELRAADRAEEMQDRNEAYRLLAEFHKKHRMDTPENVRAQKRAEAGLPPEEPQAEGGEAGIEA